MKIIFKKFITKHKSRSYAALCRMKEQIGKDGSRSAAMKLLDMKFSADLYLRSKELVRMKKKRRI